MVCRRLLGCETDVRGLNSGHQAEIITQKATEQKHNSQNSRNDEALLLEAIYIYITSQTVPAIIREVGPLNELITAADPVVL